MQACNESRGEMNQYCLVGVRNVRVSRPGWALTFIASVVNNKGWLFIKTLPIFCSFKVIYFSRPT